MILSFMKTWLRTVYKEKLLSAVMVIGLIAGLTTLTLIAVYVHFQYSFDNFHKEPDRVYRVLTDFKDNGNAVELSLEKYAYSLNNTPGIKASTRMFKSNNMQVETGGRKFTIKKAFYADPEFFKVFSFGLIAGNKDLQLSNPNEAVVTRSTAQRLWGPANAIGKTFNYNMKEYIVKGIAEDTPLNSHIQFDALISFASGEEMFRHFLFEFYTYFRIESNAGINETLNRAKETCNNVYAEYKSKYLKKINTIFQPLLEQHLKSESLEANIGTPANTGLIKILTIIGICTFIILLLNMVILITAKSQGRFKEIGIRKINGAGIRDLITQLAGESLMINVAAALLSIIAVAAVIKPFSTFFDVDLAFYSANFLKLGLFILVFGIIIGLLSSAIPVYQLIRDVKPVALLARANPRNRNRFMYSTILVQFAVVSGLITALFAFSGQVEYLKNKNLGFEKNKIAYFQLDKDLPYRPLIDELKKIEGVEKAAGSDAIPGTRFSGMSLSRIDNNKDGYITASEDRVQKEFIDTYGLKLIAGRNFTEENDNEKDNIILNETAVKMLDYTPETILNKQVMHTHGPKTVIGVVADYHFRTLHEKINPIILSNYEKMAFTYSLKINTDNLQDLGGKINSAVQKFDPSMKVELASMNELWNSMYKADEKQISLVGFITYLCVTLSVIGLMAFASYTIARRTKEIAIRKVYGAAISGILSHLYKNYIRLVIIANIIIVPVSYYFIDKWLSEFPYHLNLSAGYFIGTLLVVLAVTVVTVLYFAWKVAVKNPIDIIKYE